MRRGALAVGPLLILGAALVSSSQDHTRETGNTSSLNETEKYDDVENVSRAEHLDPALTEPQAQAEGSPHTATPRLAEPYSEPAPGQQIHGNDTLPDASDAIIKSEDSRSTMVPDSLRRSGGYSSDFSSTPIPRDEIIYLANIPGAENLIICRSEGEFYSVVSPARACLVCACVNVYGRVQAACAPCAPCQPESALLPTATLLPTESGSVTLRELDGTRAEKSCAPLPFEVPFEHPLNPCQECVCRRRPLQQAEVYVSCRQDPQCVKPSDVPLLPQALIPSTPVSTPLCGRFPVGVPFPHPSNACQLCSCLRRVSQLAEQQIVCSPDPLCESASNANEQIPTLPYIQQDQEELVYPNLQGPLSPTESVFPNLFQPTLSPSELIETPDLVSPQLLQQKDIPETRFFKPVPDKIPIGVMPTGKGPDFPEYLSYEQEQYTQPLQTISVRPEDFNGVVPFATTQTTITEQPITPREYLPWPPVTVATPLEQNHPLLGPPPHESCRPFPTHQPFQHPWASCQLCVCAEYPSPGRVSIEVNCYTKPECCITATPPQAASSTALTFAPAVTKHQIIYIEPRCRSRDPDKQFLLKCNICSCQTVYNFVIMKCTPQPKCILNLDSGIDIEVTAVASEQNGFSYGHSVVNTLPSNAGATDTADPNAYAVQPKGNNHFQYGYYTQNPLNVYRPKSTQSPITFTKTKENNEIEQQRQTQFYPSYSYYPQTTPLTASFSVPPQGVYSAEAFAESINGPLYNNVLKPIGYEYSSKNPLNQQSPPGPQPAVGTSTHTYWPNSQKTQRPLNPYEKFVENYAKPTEYAQVLASSNSLANGYSNLNKAYAYVAPQFYKYPTAAPAQSYWGGSKLANDLLSRESDARAQQIQALVAAGATRTGRGRCQYAGDRYHSHCRACFCFADENQSDRLYSMCLGKSCN